MTVGTPLTEAAEQWWTLLKITLLGVPLALLFAAGGGWWVGRHGLLPMQHMVVEAQAITEKTLDSRLTVRPSITEIAQLARSAHLEGFKDRRRSRDARSACVEGPHAGLAKERPRADPGS